MKYLVIGAGMMGFACAYDLLKNPATKDILVIDTNENNIQRLVHTLQSAKIKPYKVDINDCQQVLQFMQQVDVAIGAVSYQYNYSLTSLAIEAGCHFCDLGGNNNTVEKQFTLHDKAVEKNVIIIPDCGLAPGLASNLLMFCISKMDRVEEASIRVGGLPQNPKPPLNYELFFSPQGLINEYIEPPITIHNHEVSITEPLGDLESLNFNGISPLEAFNTSGGLSTLPYTMATKIKNLNYKTIRYKGHQEKIKFLMDLGLTNEDMIVVDGISITPKNVLIKILENCLPRGTEDVVLIRVLAKGYQKDFPLSVSIELIEKYDASLGLTAMMKTTGFHISIIAQMLASGTITNCGVQHNELAVNPIHVINAFERRGIYFNIISSES